MFQKWIILRHCFSHSSIACLVDSVDCDAAGDDFRVNVMIQSNKTGLCQSGFSLLISMYEETELFPVILEHYCTLDIWVTRHIIITVTLAQRFSTPPPPPPFPRYSRLWKSLIFLFPGRFVFDTASLEVTMADEVNPFKETFLLCSFHVVLPSGDVYTDLALTTNLFYNSVCL